MAATNEAIIIVLMASFLANSFVKEHLIGGECADNQSDGPQGP
jgi:hypothetical protein